MKPKKILAGCAVALACLSFVPHADAAAGYVQRTNGATFTSTNYVVFPALSQKQFVVRSVDYRSQTNLAQLVFASGLTAYTATGTNTSTGVTNLVNSTNGITPGNYLLLDRGGVGYLAAVSAIGQSTNNPPGTNYVLASGGWGVAPQIGDNIYTLDTFSSFIVGQGTNFLSPLFVGNLGRPVVVFLGPAGGTNYLRASGSYE